MQQNFTGLIEVDSRYELNLNAVIEGRLPELDQGDQVIFPDYNQEYEFSGKDALFLFVGIFTIFFSIIRLFKIVETF